MVVSGEQSSDSKGMDSPSSKGPFYRNLVDSAHGNAFLSQQAIEQARRDETILGEAIKDADVAIGIPDMAELADTKHIDVALPKQSPHERHLRWMVRKIVSPGDATINRTHAS